MKRIDSFTDLGSGYGGAIFDVLEDGSFRTRTCCDYDVWDRETVTRLRDWLTKYLDQNPASSRDAG